MQQAVQFRGEARAEVSWRQWFAEELGARGVAGRDVFKRGAPGESASGEPPLASLSLVKLIDAFQKIAPQTEAGLYLVPKVIE